VKKIVLCVCALLACAATRARADELPDRSPTYTGFVSPSVIHELWSGLYVGANGGYSWINSSVSYAPADAAATRAATSGIPSAGYRMDGAFGGGQIGYNFQFTNLLLGVEADYQWAGFEGTGTSLFRLTNVGNTSMVANESMDSFGTVRARVGLVAAAPLLVYATGGLAYGRLKENLTVANPLASGSGSLSAGGFSYLCTAGGPPCFAGSSSKEILGWTLGAGGEYLVTDHVSLRAEFLYVSFSNPSGTAIAQNTLPGTAPSSFAAGFGWASITVLRGGLNFKF
jgi:outer membrane immunogenic protein